MFDYTLSRREVIDFAATANGSERTGYALVTFSNIDGMISTLNMLQSLSLEPGPFSGERHFQTLYKFVEKALEESLHPIFMGYLEHGVLQDVTKVTINPSHGYMFIKTMERLRWAARNPL